MADLFFDSSALVKRYINEVGSNWVTRTANAASGNNIFIAAVTGVELTAAIARRTRGASTTVVDTVFARLQHDLTIEYFDLAINPAIFQDAKSLARKYFLKGYDAVQLAAAAQFNREQIALGLPKVTLISADDLLIAADAEGLLIKNPNNYP